MALGLVNLNIEYYPDPTQGRPVFNGSVYVGLPDLDPVIEANRVTVTLRQEGNPDLPILPPAQPLTTGPGGVITFNGSPAQILVDGNYSIKVLNSTGSQVYYISNAFAEVVSNTTEAIVVADKSDALALTVVEGKKVFITSSDGGEFTMRTSAPIGTYNDNGGVATGTKFTNGDGSSGIERDFNGTIKSEWFGAFTGGVIDYIDELQNALLAADSSSNGLDLQAGTYKNLSKQLSISTANKVNIKGAGRGLTVLEFSDTAINGGGIDITFSTLTLPPEITGLTLKTNAMGVGTAIKITSVVAGSSTIAGPKLQDFDIYGINTAANYWNVGVDLIDCWYPSMRSFSIKGLSEVINPFSMAAGIRFERSQGLFLRDFTIFHTENAILQAGVSFGEGVNFAEFEIVGVANGIVLNGAGGTFIGNGHINAYVTGIDIVRTSTTISGMLIFKTHLSTSDFIGIKMNSSQQCAISDNDIEGSQTATGGMTGIELGPSPTSRWNNIHDNKFQDFEPTGGIGIKLLGDCNNNSIVNNRGFTNVTTIVDASAAGINNIINDNTPYSAVTFDADDLTPDVANYNSPYFRTANTTPMKLVTDFERGYDGQTIQVLANDAFTTIVHNVSAISLSGSTNYIMGPGEMISLRYDVTVWREITRSAI